MTTANKKQLANTVSKVNVDESATCHTSGTALQLVTGNGVAPTLGGANIDAVTSNDEPTVFNNNAHTQ